MIDHNELVQGVLKLVPILRLPEDVKEPDTVVIGVLGVGPVGIILLLEDDNCLLPLSINPSGIFDT